MCVKDNTGSHGKRGRRERTLGKRNNEYKVLEQSVVFKSSFAGE